MCAARIRDVEQHLSGDPCKAPWVSGRVREAELQLGSFPGYREAS